MAKQSRNRTPSVVLIVGCILAIAALALQPFVRIRVRHTEEITLQYAPLAMTAVDETTTVEQLAQLLDEHPSLISDRDGNGDSLLCHAADEGSPEVVALLLERGADPNAKGFLGLTPLLYAIPVDRQPSRRDVEVIRLLLNAGADPNARCARGSFVEIAQEREWSDVLELVETNKSGTSCLNDQAKETETSTTLRVAPGCRTGSHRPGG